MVPTHRDKAILTHLAVVAGSEIVAGWEAVMSTRPLSDTFPGNLAVAGSLEGLGRRSVRGVGVSQG